jgi:hypothetical protein
MARVLSLIFLPLLLGGCLSAMAANENTSRVRLNQVASLGQVRVTPLQVIEDSRCPSDVQCVWAGQLRLRASVATPSGEHLRVLTLGQPQAIGGGALVLQDVTPQPDAEAPTAAGDYSFVLHYTIPSAR